MKLRNNTYLALSNSNVMVPFKVQASHMLLKQSFDKSLSLDQKYIGSIRQIKFTKRYTTFHILHKLTNGLRRKLALNRPERKYIIMCKVK